jgi:hypothetical protein
MLDNNDKYVRCCFGFIQLDFEPYPDHVYICTCDDCSDTEDEINNYVKSFGCPYTPTIDEKNLVGQIPRDATVYCIDYMGNSKILDSIPERYYIANVVTEQ